MKLLAIELGLMVVVALAAVGLAEMSARPAPAPPSPTPTTPAVRDVQATIERKAQPHQTHPDMLQIYFTLYPDRPPIIDEVSRLAEGRLSTPPPGDNSLKLIGPNGQILYTLSFAGEFILLDGATEPLAEMSYSYVLPDAPQVTKVVLGTPQGEVVYDGEIRD